MSGAEFERIYDEEGVLYYPIRHHSPACAFHLKKLIRKTRPQCVLIEGPDDCGYLIKYLQDTGAKPPICIYSAFDDRKGLVSGEQRKYRAYYPFLSYSPELCAIKTAAEVGAQARFIDMPFAMQLVNYGGREQSVKTDESAEYYRLAAQKSGCSDFAQFWESGFETSSCEKSTEEFVHSVFLLGLHLRELSEPQRDNLYREYYMRKNIAAARLEFEKIIVVTGAYHTPGLLTDEENFTLVRPAEGDCRHYLMPYSFAEMDSRNGYGAGIKYPAFYNAVWQQLEAGNTLAYESTVKNFIIKTARMQRELDSPTIPDEIQAVYMANELAALRAKAHPGVYELIDSVKSAFVKGDINSPASLRLDMLYRLITGLGAGSIDIGGAEDIIPPCVIDFRAKCKKYRINLSTLDTASTTLDIVKNKRHYEKSCFLHRLVFLDTRLCKMLSGPDYSAGKNTSLAREKWEIRFSSDVETRLIDLSVYGDSIEGICLYFLSKRSLGKASEAGRFMLSCFTMGFSQNACERLPEVYNAISGDNDFFSQSECLTSLRRLLTLQDTLLLQGGEDCKRLMGIAFYTALNELENVKSCGGRLQQRVCEGLRSMYSLCCDLADICKMEDLLAAVKKCMEGAGCAAQIYGVCLMTCKKAGVISEDSCCERIEEYIATATAENAADFISGVILSGRDILFSSQKPLRSIDRAIRAMSEEEFQSLLPLLRRAFTALLPHESLRIARNIAQLYGTSQIRGSDVFTAEQLMAAAKLDKSVGEIMKRWGFL